MGLWRDGAVGAGTGTGPGTGDGIGDEIGDGSETGTEVVIEPGTERPRLCCGKKRDGTTIGRSRWRGAVGPAFGLGLVEPTNT